MRSEIERYRELGVLIRAAQAELDRLQIGSVQFDEFEFDLSGLYDHISNLKGQISGWKNEQKSLFHAIAEEEDTKSSPTADMLHILDYFKPGNSSALLI